MILPVILLLMGFCSIRVGASQSLEFSMQINRSVLLQNEEIFSRYGQTTGIRTTMIQFKRQTFSYTEPCSFN